MMRKLTTLYTCLMLVSLMSYAQESERVDMNAFDNVAEIYVSTGFRTEPDMIEALTAAAKFELNSEIIQSISIHVFWEESQITSGHGVFRSNLPDGDRFEEIFVFLHLLYSADDEEQWELKLNKSTRSVD